MFQATTATANSNQPRLSKSKIAAFEHCPRRLWLQVYRRELAQFDEAILALFQCGHYVGELARRRYSRGHLVAEDHLQVPAAIARTQELLAATIRDPIFEAAFERDGVIIRADILEPDSWGGWSIVEVKNTARVGTHIIRDVATQLWVLQGNKICVSSAFARHVERPLLPTSRNPSIRFVDLDVTAEALRVAKYRQEVVDNARATLAGPEPAIKPSQHCERPGCEFRGHCCEVKPVPQPRRVTSNAPA